MTNSLLFESLPSPERSIERHYIIGKFSGLKPKTPEQAKVLELGCGNATTLIAQAVRFPSSKFIGIDHDRDALELGYELINDLGISNVELKEEDIENLSISNANFDYIICHGLFSWVASKTQEKILENIQQLLDKNGIAYLSFNCLPGWFCRGIVRDQLREKIELHSNKLEQVQKAQEVLENIAKSYSNDDQNLMKAVKLEADLCNKQSPAFIYHELLSEQSYPYFINSFTSKLTAYNLHYIGDGRPARMRAWRFEEETQLNPPNIQIHSYTEKEQWLDYLKPISFRGALVGKSKTKPQTQWQSDFISNLHVSCPLVAKNDPPDVHGQKLELFIGPAEENIEVFEATIKACLLILQRNWCQSLNFKELCSHSCEMALGKKLNKKEQHKLADTLLKYFRYGLLELYIKPLDCKNKIEQKPKATKLARIMSKDRFWVSNSKPEYLAIGPFEKILLPALDGTRDEQGLISYLHNQVQEGNLGITDLDKLSESQIKESISFELDNALAYFCEHGLLI